MTIKQLGGVFGRNPTFNDVTIEGTLTFDGDIDITSDLTIEDNLYVLGSVGIGTSSVDSLLHLSSSSGPELRIENTDTALTEGQVVGSLVFEQNDSTSGGAGISGRIQMRSADRPDNGTYFGTAADMDFLVSGASSGAASDGASKTAMTIRAGTGNVGIGISPSKKLTVFGTGAGNATVQIEGEGGADPYINFLANNTQHWSLGIDDSDSDKFKLSKHSALGTNDYFVVDVNGNVLVGKTATNIASDGVQLFNDGFVHMTADISSGSQVLTVNRKTSDGDLAVFRKDGTAVGSIGSNSGTYMYAGTGDTGILFNVDAGGIQPWDTSTNGNSDGLLNLGFSGSRFKDLYLSGGVYVGGTSAANLLDDYEEGTWTPTVAGDATGTFSAAEGTYTKVGRLVFIEMYVVVSANFTSNYIGGLPFTVGDLLTGTSLGQSAVVLTNAADTVTGAALEGSGNMRFFNDHNTASFHNPDTTNGGYRLSLCYQAT